MTATYRVFGLAPDARDFTDLGQAMWTATNTWLDLHTDQDDNPDFVQPELRWHQQQSGGQFRYYLRVDGNRTDVRVDEVPALPQRTPGALFSDVPKPDHTRVIERHSVNVAYDLAQIEESARRVLALRTAADLDNAASVKPCDVRCQHGGGCSLPPNHDGRHEAWTKRQPNPAGKFLCAWPASVTS